MLKKYQKEGGEDLTILTKFSTIIDKRQDTGGIS